MNASATWSAIAATGLCVCAMGAQAPPTPKASGLIMGVVVDSINDKPVSEALVTIGNSKVRTDGEGRFVFAEMAKGRYAISATKTGYLEGAFGRRRPEGPSAMLPLGADERVGNLRIAVFKLSAISGQVADELNEPIVGAEVNVLAKGWIGGRLVMTPVGRTSTDDRGFYRVGGLAADEFVVSAVFQSLPIVKADGSYAYPIQYFSGGTAVETATPVAVNVGDERPGIDITLRPARAARISGVLRTSYGPVAGPLILTKTEDGFGAGADLGAARTMSEPNGAFTFPAVPTGAYVIKSIVLPPSMRAENSLAPTQLMWGSTPVVVDGTDIRNLEVMLRPGFRIVARVASDAGSGRRGLPYTSMRGLAATLESTDVDVRLLGSAATLTADMSGNLTSLEVPPGRYFIRIDPPPPGWSLKSITQQGRDITNAPARFDGSTADIMITFTDRPAELGGFVRGDAGNVEGATVVVFPRDRSAWDDFGRKPPGFRASRSSRDGSYRFVSLPPGDYFVIALDDASATDWQQTERLERFATVASRATVALGDNPAVDLKPMVIR